MDHERHGKNLKMLKEFKDRKVLKQQKAEENDWGPPKPFDMSFLDNLKVNFTQEENYEAYKLFCIMDVDNSGLVSLRELERVLMGDTLRIIEVDFEHPDSGIVWNLDTDECVAIQRIETASPASLKSELVSGLRLLRVNETPMTLYQPRSLEVLHKELIKIHDDYVYYQFKEPLFIITAFSNSLDIQVDGRDFNAKLPIGAVNNLQHFEDDIHTALKKCHPSLGLIDVHIDSKSRQVTFACDRFPFRLMFKTGKCFQTSCRYALGFSAVDSPPAMEHKGQALSIDLNLGITQMEMEILMNELFSRFDVDGSGEFQFEEFRDFYIRFLATPESVELLRRFAAHRFRDMEVEKRRNVIMEARRKKAMRRKYLREKNKDVVAEQIKRLKANSVMNEDGMIRRMYKAKREDQIQIRLKKNRGRGPAPPEAQRAVDEFKKEEDVEEKAGIDRDKVKAKQREQEIRRKKKLNELLDIGAQLEKDLKKLQRDATNREARLHMAEIGQILQKSFQHAFRLGATGVEGMNCLSLTQNRVLTPALKITPEMFRNGAQVEDINLEDLGPELMHPAAKRYFFARALKSEEFDVTRRHPAFFGCDYRREGSRHSSLALGAVRAIVASRTVFEAVEEKDTTDEIAEKVGSTSIDAARRDYASEFVQQAIHDEFTKIVFKQARALVEIDVIFDATSKLLTSAVTQYEHNEVKRRIADEVTRNAVDDATAKIIETWYMSGGTAGNISYTTPSSASSIVGSVLGSPVRRISGLDGALFTGGPMMNLEDLRDPLQSTDNSVRPKTASSVGSSRNISLFGDGGLASRRQSRIDVPGPIPEKVTAGMQLPGLARLVSHSSCESDDDDSDNDNRNKEPSEQMSSRKNSLFTSNSPSEDECDQSIATTIQLPNLSDEERNRMIETELQSRLDVRTLVKQFSSDPSQEPVYTTADHAFKRFCYMYSLAVIGASCDRVTDAMFTIASTKCSHKIDGDTLENPQEDDESSKSSKSSDTKSTQDGDMFDIPPRSIPAPGPRTARRTGQILQTQQVGPTVGRSDSVEPPPDYYPQPNQMLLSVSLITMDSVLGVESSIRSLRPVFKGCLSTGSWEATSFVGEISKSGTEFAVVFSEFNFISAWNNFHMRFTQSLHLRCIDAATRRHIGTIEVPYADIDAATDRSRGQEVQCVKVRAVMHCAHQFNNGRDVNVTITLRVHIDGADYSVPNRPVSYFDQRRAQHWATYPITPINAGVVRQRFKDVAIAYDRQMIINPCFYGFSVRWKGGHLNESMFLHPMFNGFTLAHKPLSKQMMEDLHLQAQKKTKPNPWKFKPGGVCPICYDGQPGCPRCWSLPLKPNGDPSRLEDFAFNPDKEAASIAARNNKIVKRQEALELKRNTKRFLEQVGALRSMREDDVRSEVSSSSSESEDDVQLSTADDETEQIHTKLTTEDGIRLYRSLILENVNVYVKVMPGSHIRQLVADPRDAVLHLHNMFKTHSDTGNSKGSMLILPTAVGFYEMDADVTPANEFLLGRNTGSIPLSKYGFRKRGSTICLLYFPKYLPQSTSALLMAFFKENMDIVLPSSIPTVSHNKGVPSEIENDIIQENLVKILRRQYFDQQIQERLDMAARAKEQKIKKQLEESARMERIRQQKIEDDKRRIVEEKRLAAQLKGLNAEEKEAVMTEIFREEMEEKMQTGTKDEIAALEKVHKAALRMAAMESRKERKEQRSLSRSLTAQSTVTTENNLRPVSREPITIESSLASLTIKEEDKEGGEDHAIENDEMIESAASEVHDNMSPEKSGDVNDISGSMILPASPATSQHSPLHSTIESLELKSARSEYIDSVSNSVSNSRRSSGVISELTTEQSTTGHRKRRRKSKSNRHMKTSHSAPMLTEHPSEDCVSAKSPAGDTTQSNLSKASSACVIH